jgi:hypothetical protein
MKIPHEKPNAQLANCTSVKLIGDNLNNQVTHHFKGKTKHAPL